MLTGDRPTGPLHLALDGLRATAGVVSRARTAKTAPTRAVVLARLGEEKRIASLLFID